MTRAAELERLEFFRALNNRLDAGALVYGDRSFERPTPEVSELEQEALDLAGWGFVLWARLRRLRAATDRLDAAGGQDA